MTSPPPKVDAEALLEVFRKYLRDHNLPVTHQREAIARAVFFSDEHLSVGDIERSLEIDGVRAGKATIYRTLELMSRGGLVQEHDFGEGFKRYEPLGAQTHHEHLICVECGKVVEFSSERFERMKSLIADEYGYRYHHHRLEIYGVCPDCQKRAASSLQVKGQVPGA